MNSYAFERISEETKQSLVAYVKENKEEITEKVNDYFKQSKKSIRFKMLREIHTYIEESINYYIAKWDVIDNYDIRIRKIWEDINFYQTIITFLGNEFVHSIGNTRKKDSVYGEELEEVLSEIVQEIVSYTLCEYLQEHFPELVTNKLLDYVLEHCYEDIVYFSDIHYLLDFKKAVRLFKIADLQIGFLR